ncbi:hypothetical protein SLE2022_269630 [Rubroshorea leprosula]
MINVDNNTDLIIAGTQQVPVIEQGCTGSLGPAAEFSRKTQKQSWQEPLSMLLMRRVREMTLWRGVRAIGCDR